MTEEAKKLSPEEIQQRQQAKYNEKVLDLVNVFAKVAQLYEFDVVVGANARISMQLAKEVCDNENTDLNTLAFMAGVYKGVSENLIRNRESRMAASKKAEENDRLASEQQRKDPNQPGDDSGGG